MQHDEIANRESPGGLARTSRADGPLGAFAIPVLCLLWVLLGLTGHDPWKPDEAYTMGLVFHIYSTGDWIVPTLGGEPFMEKPPLFFICAALFAKLFGGWMPLHDAARLATGMFLALTLWFINLAARELNGRDNARLAPLLFVGCIGLFEVSHRLQTDMALLSGVALAVYALALMPRRWIVGGTLLGIGTGVAFLSKGLIGPGLIGTSTLSLTLFPRWRHPDIFRGWGVALVAALPFLLIWPLLLFLRDPALFHTWLWDNNFGRFFGFSHLGFESLPWFYTRTLPWFAWPALPLAAWAAWHELKTPEGRDTPGLQLPIVVFAVMLAILASAHDALAIYGLPLLIPVCLLGARGAAYIGTAWTQRISILNRHFFGIVALLVWFCWAVLLLNAPAPLAEQLSSMEPGYSEHLRLGAVTLALGLTAAWLFATPERLNHPQPLLWSWSSGSTLVWGLLCTLWMPYVNHGKTFVPTLQQINAQLTDSNCLASRGLGEPQRALLEYYHAIRTMREEIAPNHPCNMLLTQDRSDVPTIVAGSDWHLVWQGTRPGDQHEMLKLYRREGAVALHQSHPEVTATATYAGPSHESRN